MIGAPRRKPKTCSSNLAAVTGTPAAELPTNEELLFLVVVYTEPSKLFVPERVTALIPAPTNPL